MVADERAEVESKSARKRAHLALQALAERLMELPTGELARVPLEAALAESVAFGRALTKGARRRHVRRLAKLLSRAELAPIHEAMAALDGESRRETARLHRAERWRERLLAEGDAAIGELAEAHPQLDRQRLRGLLRGAARERERAGAPRQFRELLRYLRHLEEAAD